jgi:hypothetical protein
MLHLFRHVRAIMFAAVIAVPIAAAVAPATVRAQDVRTNSMPGTDFSKYKTYRWVTIEGAHYPNQILDAQIKQAIDQQMAAKGFTKTDAPNADLDLAYQASMNKQTQWSAYSTGGVRWGWGGGMAVATPTTINTGTLILDMYDVASKTLVWQGSATKTVNPGNSQEKIQKNLDNAMKKLLKDFPPKAK